MKPASGSMAPSKAAGFRFIVQRYWLTALIAVAVLGVVGVFAWETGWGSYLFPRTPNFSGAPRQADNIVILPPFVMPPIDPTYKETVERPLFSQSRRPNPPAAAVAAAPVMEKGKYRLSGTSVNAQVSTAFLVDIRSGKTWRVVKGAIVDPTGSQGATLDSVDATRVVLKLGDETEVLTLATSKSAAVLPPNFAQNAIPPGAQAINGATAQVIPPSSALSAGPQSTNSFGVGGAFGRPPNAASMPVPLLPGQTGNVPLPPPTGANSGPVPIQNDARGMPIAGAVSNSSAATNSAEPTAARRRRFQNLPQ